MLEMTQPALTGITAQAASASVQRDERRQQEDALVGAGRNDRLLQHEFEQVGEGLEQAPGPDHVRAAPDLHRRPDFPVGIKHVGDGNKQDDEQQHALGHHDDQRPDVIGPELGHRRSSYCAAATAARPCAMAEHSAITAEHRAMALVK